MGGGGGHFNREYEGHGHAGAQQSESSLMFGPPTGMFAGHKKKHKNKNKNKNKNNNLSRNTVEKKVSELEHMEALPSDVQQMTASALPDPNMPAFSFPFFRFFCQTIPSLFSKEWAKI